MREDARFCVNLKRIATLLQCCPQQHQGLLVCCPGQCLGTRAPQAAFSRLLSSASADNPTFPLKSPSQEKANMCKPLSPLSVCVYLSSNGWTSVTSSRRQLGGILGSRGRLLRLVCGANGFKQSPLWLVVVDWMGRTLWRQRPPRGRGLPSLLFLGSNTLGKDHYSQQNQQSSLSPRPRGFSSLGCEKEASTLGSLLNKVLKRPTLGSLYTWGSELARSPQPRQGETGGAVERELGAPSQRAG
ncbi:uncharacterized protein LOC122731739 [Dromiciops gliroides]|uniref:uncharacterized protein LOC122731739 n=1 Tax=Dromiciops gliroides TaxID=33562 RepID=UPI001CC7D3AD|nr:uncharacterized protein LOC122731739 [Dromiciops gliroides]